MKAQLCTLSVMLVLLVVFVPFPDAESVIGPVDSVREAPVPAVLSMDPLLPECPETLPSADGSEDTAVASQPEQSLQTGETVALVQSEPELPPPSGVLKESAPAPAAVASAMVTQVSVHEQGGISGKGFVRPEAIGENNRPNAERIHMDGFRRMMDFACQDRFLKRAPRIVHNAGCRFEEVVGPSTGNREFAEETDPVADIVQTNSGDMAAQPRPDLVDQSGIDPFSQERLSTVRR